MNYAADKNINSFHKGFRSNERAGNEDPTYLGFRINILPFSVFNHETRLNDNALLTPASDPVEGAERYLINIGMQKRADMIKRFREELVNLTRNNPWYIQSVTGVSDLWRIARGKEFDTSRHADLVFTTLESIDMRMTALFDLYRKATFDYKNMREILPVNLRHFKMELQIAEFRKFHKIKDELLKEENTQQSLINPNLFPNPLAGIVGTGAQGADLEFKERLEILDNIAIVSFDLRKCELMVDESFGDEFSVNQKTEAHATTFTIKVSKVYKERNQYDLLQLIVEDDYMNMNSDRNVIPGEKISSEFKPQLFTAEGARDTDNVLSRQLKNAAKSPLDRLDRGIERVGQGVRNADDFLANKFNDFVAKQSLGQVYDGKALLDLFLQFTGGNLDNLGQSHTNGTPEYIEPTGEVFDNETDPAEEPTGQVFDKPVNEYIDPEGSVFENPDPNYVEPEGSVFENPDPNYVEPDGQVFENPDPNYVAPDGQVFENPDPEYHKPDGQVFENPEPNYVEPKGEVFDKPVNEYEDPKGQVFEQEPTTYTKPVGKVFDIPDATYEAPTGSVFDTPSNEYEKPTGKVFDIDKTVETVKNVGKVFDIPATEENTQDLGRTYSNDDEPRDIQDLGKTHDHVNAPVSQDKIGKVFDVVAPTREENLGAVNTDEPQEKEEILGEVYSDAPFKPEIDSIGEVFNKEDELEAKRDIEKKSQDLGTTFEEQPKAKEQEDLGETNTQTRPQSNDTAEGKVFDNNDGDDPNKNRDENDDPHFGELPHRAK